MNRINEINDRVIETFTNNYTYYLCGYFRASEPGTYTFKLSTKNVAYLFIDEVLRIIHSTDEDGYSILILNEDYYYFEIIVNYREGDADLSLTYKFEDGDYNEFFENCYSIINIYRFSCITTFILLFVLYILFKFFY